MLVLCRLQLSRIFHAEGGSAALLDQRGLALLSFHTEWGAAMTV